MPHSDKVYDFYDNLLGDVPDTPKSNKDQEAAQKLDYLIHKVFVQNKDGAELLALWQKSLMMTPGAGNGMDQVDIGIAEGFKRFIRNIILTCNKVNEGQ